MIYIDLFLGFLKVGLFSFGGAYGAIPIIREVVLHYGWLDDEMLTYMIAVSESTPGPIMVNLATFVGNMKAGILGAALATFAVVLPSFVVILLAVSLFKNAAGNKYVKAVLSGLIPCIIGIILATGVYMIIRNCIKTENFEIDSTAIVLTVVLMAFYLGGRKILKKNISPISLIGISAVLGMLLYGLS